MSNNSQRYIEILNCKDKVNIDFSQLALNSQITDKEKELLFNKQAAGFDFINQKKKEEKSQKQSYQNSFIPFIPNINNQTYNNNTNNYNNNSNTYINNNTKKDKGFTRVVNTSLSNNTNLLSQSIIKDSQFSIFSSSKPQINVKETLSIMSNLRQNSKLFSEFNFDKLTELSSTLGFGIYNQFIYLYSPQEETSIGPFSINELKNFYSLKYIDSTTKCRLLDIFKVKGKAPFEFVTIKEMIASDFFDRVETNSYLIQITQSIKAKQDLLKQKKEETEKFKSMEMINKKEESIYSTPSGASNIKQQVKEKNQFDHIKSNVANEQPSQSKQVIKQKKKKAAELDVKLGFYAMTKEEKEYTQHYTAN